MYMTLRRSPGKCSDHLQRRDLHEGGWTWESRSLGENETISILALAMAGKTMTLVVYQREHLRSDMHSWLFMALILTIHSSYTHGRFHLYMVFLFVGESGMLFGDKVDMDIFLCIFSLSILTVSYIYLYLCISLSLFCVKFSRLYL